MAEPQPNSTYMTPSTQPPNSNPQGGTVKPTLLAFHGSGSNATIHTVQLARLMRALKSHFNVESLEAPFPSPAGPGVLPFFDGCGPFKRWMPPNEKVTIEAMRSGESTDQMSKEVEDVVRNAVRKVRSEGGKVIGLIGFSQGTKVVAGLLKAVEIRRRLGTSEEDWCDFAFGLSVCPSYPPPLYPSSLTALLASSGLSDEERKEVLESKIQIPSFLVLGGQDEWKWAGGAMVEKHYNMGDRKGMVVEWDMGHHYPVAPEESEQMKDWMLSVLGASELEHNVAR